METIFPVKFKGKLSIDQIERFVDVCMEFAADIQIDVSFVRGRNTPTSQEQLAAPAVVCCTNCKYGDDSPCKNCIDFDQHDTW